MPLVHFGKDDRLNLRHCDLEESVSPNPLFQRATITTLTTEETSSEKRLEIVGFTRTAISDIERLGSALGRMSSVSPHLATTAFLTWRNRDRLPRAVTFWEGATASSKS